MNATFNPNIPNCYLVAIGERVVWSGTYAECEKYIRDTGRGTICYPGDR